MTEVMEQSETNLLQSAGVAADDNSDIEVRNKLCRHSYERLGVEQLLQNWHKKSTLLVQDSMSI